jgi:hypothetical protein
MKYFILLILLTGCTLKEEYQEKKEEVSPVDSSLKALEKEMDKLDRIVELHCKSMSFQQMAAIEAGRYQGSGEMKFKRNTLRLLDSARYYNIKMGNQ